MAWDMMESEYIYISIYPPKYMILSLSIPYAKIWWKQSYPYDMLPYGKLTLQWKMPIVNREYIFRRSIFYCHRALNHLFGGRTQVDAATAQMTRAGNSLHLHTDPGLVERFWLVNWWTKIKKIHQLDMVNIEIWIYDMGQDCCITLSSATI